MALVMKNEKTAKPDVDRVHQVVLCLLSALLDLGLLTKPKATDQNGNYHHLSR